MSLSRVSAWSSSIAVIAAGTVAFSPLRSTSRVEPLPKAPGDTAVLQLVVGDSVPLFAGYSNVAVALTQSSNSAVAAIVGNYLSARAVGSVTITTTSGLVAMGSPQPPITPIGGRGGGPPLEQLILGAPVVLLKVNVVTEVHATNRLISEVCANVDSAFFLTAEPVKSKIPRIHEYHDCQKLIENGRYSAVVGIFASSNVDSTHPPVDPTGYMAAVIVNFLGSKPRTPYLALGLNPGTNCLIIRSTATGREAAVVPRPPRSQGRGSSVAYGDCPDNLTWRDVPDSRKGLLAVREQSGFDLLNRPIAPTAARWDWDPDNKVNYIGVKCGPATWCEIGRSGFVPSIPATTAAGNPIFKGYYDEQYLAEDTLARKPSTVWGTILPGRDATDKTQMQNRDTTRWYEHATLQFVETSATQSAARQRYNAVFSATPPAPGGGRPGAGGRPGGGGGRPGGGGGRPAGRPTYMPPVFPGNYPVVARPVVAVGVPDNAPPPTYSNYRLRPLSKAATWIGYEGMMSSAPVNPHHLHFMSHPGQAKQPTVRWRWMAHDEGIWTYCEPDGCCEYSFK